MKRRRTASDAAAAVSGKPAPDGPFSALKPLRSTLPAHAGKPGATAATRHGAPASPCPADDDAKLFRAAMSGVKTLRSGNRADLALPAPAPVPRARPDETRDAAAGHAPPSAADDDTSLLRAALQDVRPLKDSGRIEPGAGGVRPAPARRAGTPHAADDWQTLLPKLLDGAPQDDASLFGVAAGNARPLKDSGRIEAQPPPPAPEPRKRREDDDAVMRETLQAPISFEDRLDMGDEAAFLRDGLPRRVLTDLRRGRWVVQRELDLHGLTRDAARDALAQFIAEALQRRLRCVRLIHGKGLGSPGRVPILKHLSRGWLAQRNDILAFCQARPHDGGDGALLVLLRAPQPATHADKD